MDILSMSMSMIKSNLKLNVNFLSYCHDAWYNHIYKFIGICL